MATTPNTLNITDRKIVEVPIATCPCCGTPITGRMDVGFTVVMERDDRERSTNPSVVYQPKESASEVKSVHVDHHCNVSGPYALEEDSAE